MKRLFRGIVPLLITMSILCAVAQADTLTLPEGLTAIEDECFSQMTSLDVIELPEGLTTIGASAFEGSGLRKIFIPTTLSDIGDLAFDGIADGLKFVVVEGSTGYATVKAYLDENGWVEGTNYKFVYVSAGISGQTLIDMFNACVGGRYNGSRSSWANSYSEIRSKGTDCSGLVYLVFKAMGYKTEYGSDLPHGSNSLWNTDCYRRKGWITSSTWSDVTPGDLIFKSDNEAGSSSYGDVFHVGLVVSRTANTITIVHASTTTTGIISTTISSNEKWNLYGHLKGVNYADID